MALYYDRAPFINAFIGWFPMTIVFYIMSICFVSCLCVDLLWQGGFAQDGVKIFMYFKCSFWQQQHWGSLIHILICMVKIAWLSWMSVTSTSISVVFIIFTQYTHNNIYNFDKASRLSGAWASLCIHHTMSRDFRGKETLGILLTVLVTSGQGESFCTACYSVCATSIGSCTAMPRIHWQYLLFYSPHRTKSLTYRALIVLYFMAGSIYSDQCLQCLYVCTLQLTSDPKKHIPKKEANVPVKGLLVGGRVVLYTDWHYLHLLLHSKDRATKYTLRGLPRLLWAGEMRPLLGPKANDMAGDLHGKYFKVNYRVQCL